MIYLLNKKEEQQQQKEEQKDMEKRGERQHCLYIHFFLFLSFLSSSPYSSSISIWHVIGSFFSLPIRKNSEEQKDANAERTAIDNGMSLLVS